MRFLFISLLVIPSVLFSTPKRELRAAWIATVFNIDWPSSQGLSPEKQKAEFIKILDTLQEMKFNAAILQVKPTSDSFYQSKLSPWSIYLTGTQGKYPGYDPLAFFIEEAQKRAIETHVWVNPFRLLNGQGLETIVDGHIAKKNPDWIIEYNGRYYFDPGNPKVQEYVTKEILEIVQNYDIDVLHMDDYFYPYKAYQNKKLLYFNDDVSWKKYGKKFKTREDWRRNNVNEFIRTLNIEIKKESDHVQLGISPFGIWRNKSVDPRGSDTTAGQTNYDDLYADVLKWIDNGWIDYIMPQIYWHFDTKGVPYDTLVKWWSQEVKDKVNLFIGLGVYKLGEQDWPTTYIKKQVDFARNQQYVDGVSYYSAKWLTQDTKGIIDAIKNTIYPTYALPPVNSRMSGEKPFPVEVFRLSTKGKPTLIWENNDKEIVDYYTLYRFQKGVPYDYQNAENIIGIISSKSPLEFIIPNHNDSYTYGITAVSRLNKESSLVTLEDATKNEGFMIIDQLLAEDSSIEKK